MLGDSRILGVVSLDGKKANLEMVKAGYAEVNRGNPVPGLDLALHWKTEREAREAKRGMWAKREKYMSPRESRHSQKP